jgi:hypothetical protein
VRRAQKIYFAGASAHISAVLDSGENHGLLAGVAGCGQGGAYELSLCLPLHCLGLAGQREWRRASGFCGSGALLRGVKG